MYEEVMVDEVGQKRQPQDTGKLTNYGKHFLSLGSAHD